MNTQIHFMGFRVVLTFFVCIMCFHTSFFISAETSESVNFEYLKSLTLSYTEMEGLLDSLTLSSQVSPQTLIRFGDWNINNRFSRNLTLAEKCYFSANKLDSCVGNLELYKLTLQKGFRKMGYNRMRRFSNAYSRAKKFDYEATLPYIGINEFQNKEFDYALASFLKAGEKNTAQSFFCLGLIYFNGYSCDADSAEAYKCFLRGAELGCAESQYNLAYCYKMGWGHPQNILLRYLWTLVANYQGNPNMKELTDFDLKYGDFDFSSEEFDAIYDNIFISAALGLAYYDGNIISKDNAKAFQYFTHVMNDSNEFLLSDALYSEIAYRLGVLYRYGRGTIPNQDKAQFWTERAAALGHKKAV